MPTPYDAATVSDVAIAHRKGITLQQGRVLRDNPIAMQEGADTAPVNHAFWHPYDMVSVGDGSKGIIWQRNPDGAFNTLVFPPAAFAGGYEYRVILQGIQADGSSGTSISLQLQDQGGTWRTQFAEPIPSVSGGAAFDWAYDPDKIRISSSGFFSTGAIGARLTRSGDSITGSDATSSIRIVRRRSLVVLT